MLNPIAVVHAVTGARTSYALIQCIVGLKKKVSCTLYCVGGNTRRIFSRDDIYFSELPDVQDATAVEELAGLYRRNAYNVLLADVSNKDEMQYQLLFLRAAQAAGIGIICFEVEAGGHSQLTDVVPHVLWVSTKEEEKNAKAHFASLPNGSEVKVVVLPRSPVTLSVALDNTLFMYTD